LKLRWLLPLCAALWGCIEAPPIPPPDSSQAIQDGHRLYMAKCTLCHDAILPAEHAAADWPKLVDTYAPRARLQPDEKAQILAYLQQYSR
jgi:mono/diheme cytochrome c family protein